MSDLWRKNWTPIAPQTDERGNLCAITSLFGAGVDARPTALDPSSLVPQDDLDIHYSYSSMSLAVATTLSIGSYVDASVNFDERVHSFDFAVGLFKSFDAPVLPDDKIVTGTFWGMTVRILLRVKVLKAGLEVEANAGPVGFASAVELGHAKVEFQADGICSDPIVLAAVLEGIPLTGKFDIQAYNRFSEKLASAQSEMLRSARSHPERLLPIGVTLRTNIDNDSFMDEARSMRWALSQMHAGRDLKRALSIAPAWVDKQLVEELYRYKLGGDGRRPVDHNAATWAKI